MKLCKCSLKHISLVPKWRLHRFYTYKNVHAEILRAKYLTYNYNKVEKLYSMPQIEVKHTENNKHIMCSFNVANLYGLQLDIRYVLK